MERLRLSSVEPMDWSDVLLELVATSPRIAKHVHAPLQSGSDTVLRRMHRKYRPHHYADRILKARAAMPDCAVGADVMTGFPGETDQEFEDSRAFIESLPFTYLHVFTYRASRHAAAADRCRWGRRHRTHNSSRSARLESGVQTLDDWPDSSVVTIETGAQRQLSESCARPPARIEPHRGRRHRRANR